jgi:hypothetical protein
VASQSLFDLFIGVSRSVIVNHFGFNLWQICAAAATCIMDVGGGGGRGETKEKFFFF